jgi:hypothetical protein
MSEILNGVCVNVSLQGDYKFVNGIINSKSFHVPGTSIVKENWGEGVITGLTPICWFNGDVKAAP